MVAVKVGAPQLKQATPLIDGSVPTEQGVEMVKPSGFKSGTESYRIFSSFLSELLNKLGGVLLPHRFEI